MVTTMSDYRNCTDAELVRLFDQDEEIAFSLIYRRYFELLLRHAYRMLRDPDEAGDAVQDVFANLWEKRRTLTVRQSLSAYLYVATQNSVLRRIERSKRSAAYLETLGELINDGSYVTDEQVQVKELSQLIEKEIAKLPPRMQAAFRLSREKNLSNAEIGQKLGISTNTVRGQISNSLSILRKKLEKALLFTLIISLIQIILFFS